MSDQITSRVVMVRPSHFGFNPETAVNNTFQNAATINDNSLSDIAAKEFDALVEVLRKEGVEVEVYQDSVDPVKPDAVFPNNWISFHEDGQIITYPMYSPLRRLERDEELIEQINAKYKIEDRIAFETYEGDEKFLEGTGSMILDRQNKIVYACVSPRTHEDLLQEWCRVTGYESFVFSARLHGKDIYHTNVMMAIGDGIAVVCLEVVDEDHRTELLQKLTTNQGVVVILDDLQIDDFAGNMLALKNNQGEQLLVMSTRAYKSLSEKQIQQITSKAKIIHSDVSHIEDAGGGSVRCMIAENFLPLR